jgi:hypothetical protein
VDAASEGHTPIALTLLDFGADVSATDEHDRTPLIAVARTADSQQPQSKPSSWAAART